MRCEAVLIHLGRAELAEQVQPVEDAALAGRVRAHEERHPTKLDRDVGEALVGLEAHGIEHRGGG